MSEYFAVKQGVDKPELGTSQFPVLLVHWYPGRRDYARPERLPEEFHSLVRRAKKSGSKYVSFACTYIPGIGPCTGSSRCMDIDVPRKKYGRNKALGILQGRLLKKGYTLVEM